MAVNDARKRGMADKIERALGGDVAGKTVALLGLTFKPNTDDMRDAPALAIVPALQAAGARVRAYDPEGMEEAGPLLAGVDFAPDPTRRPRAPTRWSSSPSGTRSAPSTSTGSRRHEARPSWSTCATSTSPQTSAPKASPTPASDAREAARSTDELRPVCAPERSCNAQLPRRDGRRTLDEPSGAERQRMSRWRTRRSLSASAILLGVLLAAFGEITVRWLGFVDAPLYRRMADGGYSIAENQSGAFLRKNRWAFDDQGLGGRCAVPPHQRRRPAGRRQSGFWRRPFGPAGQTGSPARGG